MNEFIVPLKERLIKDWQAFCVAIQFLTVLPVASPSQINPSQTNPSQIAPDIQGRSLLWYPGVGLILGILLTLLCGLLPSPFYLTAAVVVALWVVLTGGLHLDGLADCADAWMGGLGDREKTLRLMKDPLCGSMGVLSIVLLLLLKTTALAALIYEGSWIWLWVIPLLSRLSLLLLFLSTPYVRPQGLGEILAQHFPKPLVRGLLLAVSFLLMLIMPFMLWVLFFVVVLLTFGFVRLTVLKRLQGFTGDCAGAQVELVEVALLIAAACLVGG